MNCRKVLRIGKLLQTVRPVRPLPRDDKEHEQRAENKYGGQQPWLIQPIRHEPPTHQSGHGMVQSWVARSSALQEVGELP